MGFKVIKNVEVREIGNLSEFYVRIDKYTLYKNRSCFDVLTGHFLSPEAAQSASGEFFNDTSDYDGYIPTSMSFDGKQVNYNPRLSVDLYEEVDSEPYTSSSIEKQVTEYVDFTDDGTEVMKERVEYVVQETTSTVKQRKKLDIISGSIFEFIYGKLKQKYQEDFAPCTIEDVI